MKLLRLACVGLTLSLLTQSLGLADCNCGQCCKARDDRGLLDIMDQAFSGLLAKSKKSLKSRLGAAGRPCDCQAKPSCGCEAAPGCGCEYEANCGCELTPGCDAGCACSQSVLGRAPVITPQQQVWPVAPYQPPVQQHMAPRPTAPRPQRPHPFPYRVCRIHRWIHSWTTTRLGFASHLLVRYSIERQNQAIVIDTILKPRVKLIVQHPAERDLQLQAKRK